MRFGVNKQKNMHTERECGQTKYPSNDRNGTKDKAEGFEPNRSPVGAAEFAVVVRHQVSGCATGAGPVINTFPYKLVRSVTASLTQYVAHDSVGGCCKRMDC